MIRRKFESYFVDSHTRFCMVCEAWLFQFIKYDIVNMLSVLLGRFSFFDNEKFRKKHC